MNIINNFFYSRLIFLSVIVHVFLDPIQESTDEYTMEFTFVPVPTDDPAPPVQQFKNAIGTAHLRQFPPNQKSDQIKFRT